MANESTTSGCECSPATKLIFACSGAADVGQVADLAARKLAREAVGKMFCLAGVGGRVGAIMKTTAAADRILAIDGCPLDCVKHCLEEAGFLSFEHLQLADLGLTKGQTAVNDQVVGDVASAGAAKLSTP